MALAYLPSNQNKKEEDNFEFYDVHIEQSQYVFHKACMYYNIQSLLIFFGNCYMRAFGANYENTTWNGCKEHADFSSTIDALCVPISANVGFRIKFFLCDCKK